MKKIIIAVMLLFSVVACGKKEIDISEKQIREGIVYIVGASKPFTGRLVGKYNNGQVKISEQYKEGVETGIETAYYENGTIFYKGKYINGKKEGEWNYYSKDNKLVLTQAYKNGELKDVKQHLVDITELKNQFKSFIN